MKKIVEVCELTFGYREKPVLQDVSFDVEEGEFVTIVGPNGGGKTTLLRLLMGLLKPWRGEIRIAGASPLEQWGVIGYVPQHGAFDRQFPVTTMEVALMGKLKRWGWYTKEDNKRVREVLERVGLWEKRKEPFSHLSGGQLQRLLIARALVSEARILLLDEPSASIDSESERELSQLLEELKGKQTVLLVTHDTEFVDGITDRVLCLHQTLCEHPFGYEKGKAALYGYGERYQKVYHDVIKEGEN